MNIRSLTPANFLEAIIHGDSEQVKSWLLLNHDNPDMINVHGSNGVPALNLAITHQHTEIALMMINTDADANMTDQEGKSALLAAAEAGNMAVLTELLQKPKVKRNQLSNGFNALELAALQNHGNIVRKLMNHDFPIQNDTLFKQLKEKDMLEMAMLLVDYKNERFNSLEIGELDINKEVRNTILKLSPTNFQRLKTIITNLKQMGLLERNTLSEALNRIKSTAKITAERSKSVKKEKDERGITRTLDNDVSYYVFRENDTTEQMKGGQGSVKKGYHDANSAHPDYAVKKLNCNHRLPDSNLQKTAKREVKYLQLAGRFAMWYQGKRHPVIITKWQKGSAIPLNFKHEINQPIGKRFDWLISFFTDLYDLHRQFRMHRDIKHSNVVLNRIKNRLQLIDFGAAKKIDSNKSSAFTRNYLDPEIGYPIHASCDIYAAHTVIASLFPEIFSIEKNVRAQKLTHYHPHETVFISKLEAFIRLTSTPAPTENAVIQLVNAMRDNVQYRCTSEQALSYCKAISSVIHAEGGITDEQLTACLNSTLNRNYFAVEDALLNTKRPARFGASLTKTPDENRMTGNKQVEPVTSIFNESNKKRLKTDTNEVEPTVILSPHKDI